MEQVRTASIFSRLFNIAPSQWSRVGECWFITFFFKIGSAIGWTVLTAAFVARFGIAYLPILFIVNALMIMISTSLFENLVDRMKREVLMILLLFFGAICLFFAAVLYERSAIAFFSLIVVAESFFLAQFNIFIPLLVSERFTPLESQNTFSFIESGETLGGILGGALLGLFGTILPVAWFMYVWIFLLTLTMAVFIVASSLRAGLPPLPPFIRRASEQLQRSPMAAVIASIRKIPFLKGLVIVVCFQWVFMNVLEFQFTKSVEQSITGRNEPTIARIDSEVLHAAVLFGSQGGVSEVAASLPRRALSEIDQARLSESLGVLKGGFHAAALLVQALVATRLIAALGVVGSMLLHPIIMLMSLVGMFLKFGIVSSTVTRMNFEITNVVHKNAYFASHYAFPRAIRDQAAQFLEGIVRPLGTVAGMLFIFAFQFFFAGKDLSMWIHLAMSALMFAVLFATMRLQQKYTDITASQLSSDLPYPDKLNAIEILAQRGHKNAPTILAEKLAQEQLAPTSSAVRIKLLGALGEFADYATLPDILEALSDPDADVRLQAASSLMHFDPTADEFYEQAFSRYRMIETLKDVFRREQSASVKSAIIRVFSVLREPAIVSFLLELLRDESAFVRADCIHTLGLFHDPNAAYYIKPFLNDADPRVVGEAVVALWQFPKYRRALREKIDVLLGSEESAVKKAGIFAVGELKLPVGTLIDDFFGSPEPVIRIEAAFALAKRGEAKGIMELVDHFLNGAEIKVGALRRFAERLEPRAKRSFQFVLTHLIADAVKKLRREPESEYRILKSLKNLYQLVDHHEELYALDSYVASHEPAHA